MDFDGSFAIDGKLTVNPKLTAEIFKNSPLYKGQNLSRFFWVKEDCMIRGYAFIVGFYFKNAVISQIQLYCMDESLQDEEQRKVFHDKFVSELASQQKYSWGEITSAYEKREQISLIFINFTNEKDE